ncbi:hypothetical protein HPP92_019002 [Vanilla planifolia]|uniref:DUF4005 domain-containing protein n=1 Tax=Vanilla planifolia TaxID=51239 RepID=A0A835UMS8_VANPL|nr:hypothetical protein HPP92_019002 [Vanilla planifolia]
MGKRWLSVVKKVFSSVSKEKKNEEKSRKKWGFGKSKETKQVAANPDLEGNPKAAHASLETQSTPSTKKSLAVVGDEHAFSVAIATAVAAEAAVVAARAAAEVVHLTTSLRSVGVGSSREEVAAIKVQNAFRAYLARRGLQGSQGMVRLKSFKSSNAFKCQTMNSLYCIRALATVQSQVRARRIKLSEEKQALNWKLKLKRDTELENTKLGQDWNNSLHSKEQMDAILEEKEEAARRRERTLTYAYSRQCKNVHFVSGEAALPAPIIHLVSQLQTQNGTGALERRMSSRPLDNTQRCSGDGELLSDSSSINSSGGWNANGNVLRVPPSRPIHHPRPWGKVPSRARARSKAEDDRLSVRSERRSRRHSIGATLSDVDNDSLMGLPTIPGYLSSTESTRAKSRFQTPPAGNSVSKASTPARKQPSFPSNAHKSRLSELKDNFVSSLN